METATALAVEQQPVAMATLDSHGGRCNCVCEEQAGWVGGVYINSHLCVFQFSVCPPVPVGEGRSFGLGFNDRRLKSQIQLFFCLLRYPEGHAAT